jgi:hypothetical protein
MRQLHGFLTRTHTPPPSFTVTLTSMVPPAMPRGLSTLDLDTTGEKGSVEERSEPVAPPPARPLPAPVAARARCACDVLPRFAYADGSGLSSLDAL